MTSVPASWSYGFDAAGNAVASYPGAVFSGSNIIPSGSQPVTVPVAGGTTLIGGGATIATAAVVGLQFTGPQAVLSELNIIGNDSDEAVTAVANAGNGEIRELSITNNPGGTDNIGIQFGAAGLGSWNFHDIRVNADGYALLLNDGMGGSDATLVTDSRFTSGGADGICYNSPTTALTNILTASVFVSAGPAVAGPNCGFGASYAHIHGFVLTGAISLRARAEALHYEDGCTFGVSNALVLRNCGADGIRHSVGINNTAESLPLVFTGFSMEGQAAPIAGTSGFYQIWDVHGVQTRNPIVGGYAWGFETAWRLGGAGAHAATYLSSENCATVLKVANGFDYTKIPGTFFSKGATTFAAVEGAGSGGFDLGSFHQEGQLPANLINWTVGRLTPGARLSGFSGRCPDYTHNDGTSGNKVIPLFTAPRLMKGALRLFFENHGGANGSFWEADVVYNGAAWTVANNIVDSNGDFTPSVTLSIVTGKVCITVAFALTTVEVLNIWASFDGTYYV